MLRSERLAAGGHHPVAFWWLPGRDQVHDTIANKVPAPHLLQGFPQQRPVVRVVIAQERFVQSALTEFLCCAERLALSPDRFEGVASSMVHRRRGRHR